LDTSTWKIPKVIKLAEEQFDQPGDIDLLIGADLFYDMLRSGRRTRPGNYPVLKRHFLAGHSQVELQLPLLYSMTLSIHFCSEKTTELEHNLKRFWEMNPVEQSTMTKEQQACEQHFITHSTQQDDGRFVVRLPTKMDPKQLRSSRLSAEQRLGAIERRLEQEIKAQYHYFMRKYKGLDHRNPVNYQEGKKHDTVYKSSSLQGNKFHNNTRITMESNK